MVLDESKEENSQLSQEKPTISALELKRDSTGRVVVYSRADDARNRVFSFMTTKSRASMVIEAIDAMCVDERGASIPAITKWILANYAVLGIDKLKVQVKKAILKGLDDKTIFRSTTSKGALGASGSFVLGRDGKSKTSPSQGSKGKAKKSRSLKRKSFKPEDENATPA